MPLPLSNIRIIDLTRILAGPFATMTLADMGAEVIKIERPGSGDDTRGWGPPFVDGVSTYFLAVNRNKKSMTLDLKHADGRRILCRLLEKADVVVSNFRVGVMEKLGLGYEELSSRYPRLVYAVINGYGDRGPWATRPSFDVIVQAESGLMDLTGAEDGPPTKVGISLADEAAGMYLTQGILLALIERQRSGLGQNVEVALHDAMLALLTYQAQLYLSSGTVPRRLGNAHPSIVPYQPFDTADGTVVVGVASEPMWQRLCPAVGLPQLASDPRFDTNAARVASRVELEKILQERFRERDTDAWVRTLSEADIPCGRVRSAAEALDSEVTAQRQMVVRCPDTELDVTGVPIKLSRTPGLVLHRPPKLGEHTEALISELGHSEEEIEAWRLGGVI